MSLDRLSSGSVIRYQFLWAPEAARGETEGRKPRPAVVGFRLDRGFLLLFPITTKAPGPGRFFREVPETEKRRAGLDPGSDSWIILDEVNTDDIANSLYLEPGCEIGRFSRAFTLHVFREWVNERRARNIAITSRRD